MKANTLELIADHASGSTRIFSDADDKERNDAVDVARAEIESMRQPITEAALVRAGWVWDSQDREYTLTIPQRWTFFYNIEYSCLQVCCWENESSIVVRGLPTMHDLTELVRLLGGQP